eukprot:scaffold13.g211.t1
MAGAGDGRAPRSRLLRASFTLLRAGPDHALAPLQQGLQQGLRHLQQGLSQAPLIQSVVHQTVAGVQDYLTTAPTLRTEEVSREVWEARASDVVRASGFLDGGGSFAAVSAYCEDEGLFSGAFSSTDPDAAACAGGAAGGGGGAEPPSLGPEQHGGGWPGKGGAAAAPRSLLGFPIISCYSRGYAVWSLFILLLDLSYSAFWLPISIGFQVHNLDPSPAFFVDLVAGLFFCAEIWMGLHVSYVQVYQANKREVKGPWHIAHFYFWRSSCWRDVISVAIWFIEIIMVIVNQTAGLSEGVVEAFQLLCVARLVRFAAVLNSLFRLTMASGATGTIPQRVTHGVNIVYSLTVMLNFMSCLWNWLAILERYDNTWLNSAPALVRQYGGAGAGVLTPEELAAVPAGRRYLTGFNFALVTLATVGYGDIVPSTAAETVINIFQLAVGVLTFGLIMGSIADLVSNSSEAAKKQRLFQEKMTIFYADVWARHSSAMADCTELFGELPHALRQDIAWELNRAVLFDLPLFSGMDHALLALVSSCAVPADFTPGQTICKAGDVADRLWLLHDGRVQVVHNGLDVVREVEAPGLFGEAALLQLGDPAYCLRPCGYRTATSCSLWYVELNVLMPLLASRPEVMDLLCERVREAEAAAAADLAAATSPPAQRSRHSSVCAAESSFRPPLHSVLVHHDEQQHVQYHQQQHGTRVTFADEAGSAHAEAPRPPPARAASEGKPAAGDGKPGAGAGAGGAAIQLVATSVWRANGQSDDSTWSGGSGNGSSSDAEPAAGAAPGGSGVRAGVEEADALVARGQLHRMRTHVGRLSMLLQRQGTAELAATMQQEASDDQEQAEATEDTPLVVPAGADRWEGSERSEGEDAARTPVELQQQGQGAAPGGGPAG